MSLGQRQARPQQRYGRIDCRFDDLADRSPIFDSKRGEFTQATSRITANGGVSGGRWPDESPGAG